MLTQREFTQLALALAASNAIGIHRDPYISLTSALALVHTFAEDGIGYRFSDEGVLTVHPVDMPEQCCEDPEEEKPPHRFCPYCASKLTPRGYCSCSDCVEGP